MGEDQFNIYFTEVRAGWLESRIVVGEAHYDLSVQAVFSEPIRDLLQCLCDTHGLSAPTDMETDYRHVEFEWGGEGWIYLWQVRPGPDNMLAISVAFKGNREVGGVEHPVWELEFTVSWRNLASQVFTQASELLWMYGFSGYYDRWTKNFPAGQMMRLGHLLHDQPMSTDDFARELGYLAETR